MRKHTPTKKLPVRNKSDLVNDKNLIKAEGSFTFPNGDAYEGGYAIIKNKRVLVRQGHGVYTTDNFDAYEATWNNDQISADLRVRYNNGTGYEGEVNANGEMDGRGSYVFPDGACLQAIWSHGKPITDIIYKEPLGYIWQGECIANELRFTAKNHFWDEICENLNDISITAPETD